MKNTKKIIIGIYSVVIIVVLVVFFFHSKTEISQSKQKCPDNYASTDAGSAEHQADLDKWSNNFYDTHTEATFSDWSKARYQFWVDNNCTDAFSRAIA